MKFLKIKNVRTYRKADTGHDVSLTATLVLEQTIITPRLFRRPLVKTEVIEKEVWSRTDAEFLRWREDGRFLPDKLIMLIIMALAFGEAEYAS